MRANNLLKRFVRTEEATTAVEYAVMLAMILLVVISAVGNFGLAQKGMWGNVDSEMKSHGID